MTTTISPDGIAEVKRLHALGVARAQIAALFGVTVAVVKEAVRNQTRPCPNLLPDGSVCGKSMSRNAHSCARCARRLYWARFRSVALGESPGRQKATTAPRVANSGPCVGGAHHRILDERNMGICIHCGDQRQYPTGDEEPK